MTRVSYLVANDRRSITLTRFEEEGRRTITAKWDHPATAEEVRRIVEMVEEGNFGPPLKPGQTHTTFRRHLGPITIYLHAMSGPPTWWYPRLFWKRKDRVLIFGWFRAGAAVGIRKRRS